MAEEKQSEKIHIHVVDGKKLAWPADLCPICNPQLLVQARQQPQPQTYIKGNTLVYKASKAVMSTLTWWREGRMFLLSLKRLRFTEDGRMERDEQGQPLWDQLTIRIPPDQMAEWIHLAGQLLNRAKEAT